MKGLVVLSGGMDSTIALYHAVASGFYSSIEAVSFDYGSKHNREEFLRAFQTCNKLRINHKKIQLPFINDLFKSDLLKSGGKIPNGHYAESNMKKTVVPFRNGIMLAIACGYAESIGANALILGNHYGDHAIYPDCRKSFIEPMAQAMKMGTYAEIELHSPFCDMTKTDIAKVGNLLKVNFKDTYSCYSGGSIHCGLCSTCYERREAIFDAGLADPTDYIDKTPFTELRQKYEAKLKEENHEA